MFVRHLKLQTLLTLLTSALILSACNVGATPAPTIDVNAINTAAVSTAMAQISGQITQTALAAPSPTLLPTDTPASLPTSALPTVAVGASPTTGAAGALPTVSFNSTPIPGFTQLAPSPAAPAATASLGDECSNSAFEGENYPDGSVFKPGEDFKKQWSVRNIGNCVWDDGYALKITNHTKDCEAMDAVNFRFKNSKDFVDPGEGVNLAANLTAPLAKGTYQCTWRLQNDQGFWFGTPLTVVFEVKK